MERLREQWDDASSKVDLRKNSLDDMLLECRQFEEMRAQFERWAVQMEDEVQHCQTPVAKRVEEIERQQREQKVGERSLRRVFTEYSQTPLYR